MPAHPAGLLDGAGVHALYADLRQAPPQRLVGQGGEHRAIIGGNDGVGIDGEPHRGDFGGAAGLGFGVGVLPQARLPRIQAGPLLGGLEDGTVFEPLDV
ncbi:hypothetical protein D3C81_2035200 [compost metagenome]